MPMLLIRSTSLPAGRVRRGAAFTAVHRDATTGQAVGMKNRGMVLQPAPGAPPG